MSKKVDNSLHQLWKKKPAIRNQRIICGLWNQQLVSWLPHWKNPLCFFRLVWYVHLIMSEHSLSFWMSTVPRTRLFFGSVTNTYFHAFKMYALIFLQMLCTSMYSCIPLQAQWTNIFSDFLVFLPSRGEELGCVILLQLPCSLPVTILYV